MRITFTLIMLLAICSGCATFTVGDQILGDKNKATAKVMFTLLNKYSDATVYSDETTVMDLATKQEYKIKFSEGWNVHKVKVLHLPPGIYAVVENRSHFEDAFSVKSANVAESPKKAPWFFAKGGKNLCLGKITYDLVNSEVTVVNHEAEVNKILTEAKREMDFEYLPFALDAESKLDLLNLAKKGQ